MKIGNENCTEADPPWLWWKRSSCISANSWLLLCCYGIFLIFFGSIGNLLTIVFIYTEKRMRFSTRVFTITLAAVDIVTLLIVGVRFVLKYWPGVRLDIRGISHLSCRLHSYTTYMVWDTTVLLVMILSVERLLLVQCPTAFWLKAHQKRILCGVFACLVVALNAKNVVILFRKLHAKGELCRNLKFRLSANVFSYVDSALMGYGTNFVTVFCNLRLLQLLLRRRSFVLDVISSAQVNNEIRESIRSTKMVTAMALLSVLISVPLFTYQVVIAMRPDLLSTCDIKSFVNCSFHWLILTNSGWRFYVYCLFSPRFQKKLSNLCRRRRSVTPFLPNA